MIKIKGREASKQAARLMKTIHRTMAAMQDGRCHISVATSREPDYDEIIDIDLSKLGQEGKPGRSNITYIGTRR